MSARDTVAHKSIELCELRCPHLLIAVIQSIHKLESGQVIQIKATDLNAPSSIASWSRQSGNLLLDMYEENGCFVFLIQHGDQDQTSFSEQSQLARLGTEGNDVTRTAEND